MKDGRKMQLKKRPKWYGLHINKNKEKNIELMKLQNNNKPSRKMEKDFTKMLERKIITNLRMNHPLNLKNN